MFTCTKNNVNRSLFSSAILCFSLLIHRCSYGVYSGYVWCARDAMWYSTVSWNTEYKIVFRIFFQLVLIVVIVVNIERTYNFFPGISPLEKVTIFCPIRNRFVDYSCMECWSFDRSLIGFRFRSFQKFQTSWYLRFGPHFHDDKQRRILHRPNRR